MTPPLDLPSVALLAVIVFTAGCGRSDGRARDELVVFAAASLRGAFTDLGDDFEREHPGTAVTFHFAGTQELRTQLEHGATADVFAAADRWHMDALLGAGRVAAPVVFAHNAPVVVVARGAADTIRTFVDLPEAARIVVGAPDVPIGRYTLQLLERADARMGPDFRARVEARIVSRELSVSQVATKVRLGEADAAIVYRTDAAAMPDVTTIPIPEETNVVADYPIAVVTDALHPRLAQAWVELVSSPPGRHALEHAGFLVPVLP